MPRLLLLFTFMNLVVGTGAFVIGGTLEPLAQALGVSVAAAGQAMTAYALSTAVLAPLALLATGRWSRRSALVTALTLFTAGSALCAWAPSLGWLLLGRVLMGIGAFCTPVAAGIAVALVPRERQGQALARVFLGIILSYVVGVPLGAWLGYTHGGAMPLAVATGLSALAGLVVALGVPRHLETPGASFTGLGSLLRKPEVLRVLGLTLLYFTAIFSVFSYIGPVLRALVPLTPVQLSLTLGQRPVRRVALAARAAVGAGLDDGGAATDGRAAAGHGGHVAGVGPGRLRDGGAAAVAAGWHRTVPGGGAAVAQRLDAVCRHRRGRGAGRGRHCHARAAAAGLDRRAAGAGGSAAAAVATPALTDCGGFGGW